MATNEELLENTLKLCNLVEQQIATVTIMLQKSEERTLKMNAIFEALSEVMTNISTENKAQRKEFTKYVDSLTADRNQIRDEYKKLVKDCLDADARREAEVKRLEALVEKLIEKMGHGVAINNN